jgi:hypothetical protein
MKERSLASKCQSVPNIDGGLAAFSFCCVKYFLFHHIYFPDIRAVQFVNIEL